MSQITKEIDDFIERNLIVPYISGCYRHKPSEFNAAVKLADCRLREIAVEHIANAIESMANALTALIGATQGRPTGDLDQAAREISQALCKSIRDSAAEAKRRTEQRKGTEHEQDH